jgi:hypothetical protein
VTNSNTEGLGPASTQRIRAGLRYPPNWANWESNRCSIRVVGKRYPAKVIVAFILGVAETSLCGSFESTRYLRKAGTNTEPLQHLPTSVLNINKTLPTAQSTVLVYSHISHDEITINAAACFLDAQNPAKLMKRTSQTKQITQASFIKATPTTKPDYMTCPNKMREKKRNTQNLQADTQNLSLTRKLWKPDNPRHQFNFNTSIHSLFKH